MGDFVLEIKGKEAAAAFPQKRKAEGAEGEKKKEGGAKEGGGSGGSRSGGSGSGRGGSGSGSGGGGAGEEGGKEEGEKEGDKDNKAQCTEPAAEAPAEQQVVLEVTGRVVGP